MTSYRPIWIMLLTAVVLTFLMVIVLTPRRPSLTFERRWEGVKFIMDRTRGA